MEREDFAAGTSSKSTKLVHGGVRYLEKAVFNFDTVQLKLVFEALHERKRLLQNASHLSDALPIMTVSPVWCHMHTVLPWHLVQMRQKIPVIDMCQIVKGQKSETWTMNAIQAPAATA